MEAAIDMAIIEALGGSPTPMAFNELYTGLQQGTVDGARTTAGHDLQYEVP